jgi:thiamine biosynthesis lipoprotein
MDIVARTEELLGSAIEIKLPRQHSSLFPKCFAEMKRIEDAYSRFIPNSELSRLNCHLGSWQDASEELISLLVLAKEFRQKTDGNFDITLKAVLDGIGYDKDYSFQKKQGGDGLAAMLRSALPPIQTGFARQAYGGAVQIDVQKGRVQLSKEIDFGGFGKGFALDRVAALLETNGIFHYYLNAGGDIFAKSAQGQAPWEILLEHPDDPSRAIGKISLNGKSIAGSAPNRRKWGDSHHLINAKTLKPAQGTKAIFVIAKTGIEADAYATALFTAGFEEGISLSRRLPLEMLSISSTNKMYKSPGFGAELFG